MATQLPAMGGANPQNIPSMIAAGIITPEQGQAMMARAQGMGGMQPMSPMQGAQPMSQSDFSGYGKAVDPTVKSRQDAMLQEILRRRAAEMGGSP